MKNPRHLDVQRLLWTLIFISKTKLDVDVEEQVALEEEVIFQEKTGMIVVGKAGEILTRAEERVEEEATGEVDLEVVEEAKVVLTTTPGKIVLLTWKMKVTFPHLEQLKTCLLALGCVW